MDLCEFKLKYIINIRTVNLVFIEVRMGILVKG